MDMELFFNNENEKPLENIVSDGGMAAIFRTVGVVGDSMSSGEFESSGADGSRGYHDYFEYSWGQFFGRMCGSKVYNFSRGGMTAKEYWNGFADANRFWDPKYACDAYIIALGVNDVCGLKQEIGNSDDCDSEEKDTMAWYYGNIIKRLKTIQPRAKFFLMTFPKGEIPDCGHRELLYGLAKKFDNTYVLDIAQHGPAFDDEFKKRFFMLGHMNPMGYLFFAKMTASYIDYIIRHNFDDFKEVGFTGTDLHS
ncbi:MAG: SGNH/GDSL hydrolase family protein [Clostridia bacterium]|nr:SGNH/GDSL hydrolase family protein [Clostridia bacterium]